MQVKKTHPEKNTSSGAHLRLLDEAREPRQSQAAAGTRNQNSQYSQEF